MSETTRPDKSSYYEVIGYDDKPIIVECNKDSCLMKSRLKVIKRDREFYEGLKDPDASRLRKIGYRRRRSAQTRGSGDDVSALSSFADADSIDPPPHSSLEQRERPPPPPRRRHLETLSSTSSGYPSGSPVGSSSSSSLADAQSVIPSRPVIAPALQPSRSSRAVPASAVPAVRNRVPAPDAAAHAGREAARGTSTDLQRGNRRVESANGQQPFGRISGSRPLGYTGLVGGLGSSPTRIGGKKSRRRKKTMHKATKKRKYIRYRKHRKSSKKRR
jgi:hypothetical protein